MNHTPSLKAGIIIPTMNRAEFVVRQLNYYASVSCPHTIYIVDASNQNDQINKTRKAINKLQKKINVVYKNCPNLPGLESIQLLYLMVKEKYVTYVGDDDYQIPSSITKCARFLEDNPEYATASGYSVSFRLKKSGALGELSGISDYPRGQIEHELASQRLFSFIQNFYVTMFSVSRTRQTVKNWGNTEQMKDMFFSAEMLPCCLSLIDGKSKILDCLGFVRQIHDRRIDQSVIFDWLINKNWNDSYHKFHSRLTKEISLKEKLTREQAGEIVRQAFWSHLNTLLLKDYSERYPRERKAGDIHKYYKMIRAKTGNAFPSLKAIYRKWVKPPQQGKNDLHYKVLQPLSPYYKDFRSVRTSFEKDDTSL